MRNAPILARLATAILSAALAACAGPHAPVTPSPAAGNARRASATLRSETPMQADAFVDSIGVNTHLLSDLTFDHKDAVVTQRMRELGVRHIRDGIFPGQTPHQYAEERRFLSTTGARMEAITD